MNQSSDIIKNNLYHEGLEYLENLKNTSNLSPKKIQENVFDFLSQRNEYVLLSDDDLQHIFDALWQQLPKENLESHYSKKKTGYLSSYRKKYPNGINVNDSENVEKDLYSRLASTNRWNELSDEQKQNIFKEILNYILYNLPVSQSINQNDTSMREDYSASKRVNNDLNQFDDKGVKKKKTV